MGRGRGSCPPGAFWTDGGRFRTISKENCPGENEAGEGLTLFLRRPSHNYPQCGQFQGLWADAFMPPRKTDRRFFWENGPQSQQYQGFTLTLLQKKKEGIKNRRKKNRHTIWLNDTAWNLVRENYHGNNCSIQNEFIEKAIRFYSSYLAAEKASEFLPRVLGSTWESMFNNFADRMGRLLFKQTVELDILMHIVAAYMNAEELDLERLRKMCVDDVRYSNGQITFQDALKYQKGI